MPRNPASFPRSLCFVALLAACGAAAEPAARATVRDSAGVTIVENPGDTGAVPRWAVSEPEVLIGGRPEEPAYDFNQVRWAARISDGRLLVIDGATAELREYDATGGFLRTLARRGDGPGELRRPLGPWLLPGDTLEIPDSQTRRISRFSPDGTFLTSVGYDRRLEERVFANPIGRGGDGRLLSQVSRFEDLDGQLGQEGWDTWTLTAADAEGGLDTLVTMNAMYGYVRQAVEGDAAFLTRTPMPFGPAGRYRIAGGLLYTGVTSAMQVDERDAAGRLLRSIRVAWPARPVGAEDREAWREWQLANLANWRNAPPRLRDQELERIEQSPFAEVYPAYTVFDIGTTGEVWIELSRRPGDEVRQYLVLDAGGRVAGRVTLPPRVRPWQFGPDRIVAVARDDEDVEYLAVYRILRI